MNRCPNCGAQNRDGAKFCTSCGFRLPADAPAFIPPDRSPFATTSSVPDTSTPEADFSTVSPGSNVQDPASTWQTVPEPDTGPGLSWESAPPRDTAVPVSDEMVASLLEAERAEETETNDPPVDYVRLPDVEEDLETALAGLDQIDTTSPVETTDHAVTDVYDPSVDGDDEGIGSVDAEIDPMPPQNEVEQPVVTGSDASAPSTAPSVDALLRMARELEYGLIELADSAGRTQGVSSESQIDIRLLSNALNDLQSEDDLATLRESITTAQDRPRDVDVMLDLVLRADAIATVLTERDQLRHAIELAIGAPSAMDADTETELASDDQIDI